MHKTEFVRQVARQTRLSQPIVLDVLNASHRLIEATLREGGNVTFPGFGSFYQGKRKGGKVRHIQTGKTVEYPGRNVALFKVGEYLKRAVAGKRRR